MAKQIIVKDGKYYFFDESTGEIYEVILQRQITADPALLKELVRQVYELKKAKGE
jgi:hypothetical protein